ncbi:MAG: hypothetical protein R2862_06895 [Thermoanaerobaculia bacterium]
MNRSARSSFAGLAGLCLGACLLLASGAGAGTLNGVGVTPEAVQLGSIEVSAPVGCVVAYTVSVVTTRGPQPEQFEIEVADDGVITQIVPLEAPADGALHVLQGSFALTHPPANGSPGVGIYLVDDGLVLDAVDPFGLPCSAPDVPALAGTGYLALIGVLALVALLALRRLRRPSAAGLAS